QEGDDREKLHELTQTGEIFGSPLYMSPEQCVGKDLDNRSDIYSMGCLMYETLAGKPPLKGENFLETLYKQLNDNPPAFAQGRLGSALHKRLEQITFKALEKDPANRYQTMRELKHDIENALQGQAIGWLIQVQGKWRRWQKSNANLVWPVVAF